MPKQKPQRYSPQKRQEPRYGLEEGKWHVSNEEQLKLWVKGMVAWGKRVREDIRNIEDHLMLPPGDPGDPPPQPE
jgi:hypothetical protein